MYNRLIKLIYSIIFFLLSFNLSANSDIVKKIEILGNDRISSDTIILFSDIKLNQDVNEIDLNNIIKNLYETNYFKNVTTSFNKNILTISVNENPIIGSIEFQGIKAKRIRDTLSSSISLKSRSSLNEFNLKNDKLKISQILKDMGYYFADVEIISETQSDKIINIIFKIDLGKKTKINKITFNGNKYFKDNKLKSIIISEEYKPWKFISGRKYLKKDSVELDKRLLKNFYLNKGFYNVEINSSFAKIDKDNNFELIFNINSNERFFFDNLTLNLPIDYNKDNYLEIFKLFSNLKGKTYSIKRIEKIINDIDKISTNEQFESTKSTVQENIIDNKINLNFTVEETEKIVVKRINILGNNITRENVLRNQLELDEGDVFNDILALKSINNLKSLGFFKDVNLDLTDPEDGFKEMNISVSEKPTGEITAGAGVGTSGATIGFGVRENNYLGSGVAVKTNFELSEDSIKGMFSLKNPNYNNTDKSVYTTLEATETNKLSDFGYKTNKTGFSFGTSFEYYDDFDFGLGVNTFFERIEADSSASERQKKQVGNYFDTFLNFNFDYDKRDQKFQPSDGFKSYYSLNLPLVSDSQTIVNSYTYSGYYEYFDKNVLKSSFFLKSSNSLTGKNVKLSERNYIPSYKLRGFEYGKVGPKDGDDFIGANIISTINFSSTIPQILENSQSTDISVFLDIANLWGVDYDSSLDNSNNIRSSIGIGLDWFSPIGPMNFSLSQPLSKNSSDITETFRFNLGTTF